MSKLSSSDTQTARDKSPFKGTPLLGPDGSASMATALMSSHHAFRRDVGQFALALAKVQAGDTTRVAALQEEWKWLRSALHGHHEVEDNNMFPGMKSAHPELAPALERLSHDHRKIDPLLERGDQAFAELPDAARASVVIRELAALLDEHLAFEEANVTPLLRNAKEFPAPATDEEAAMYAQGFSWSMHGLAPSVLAALDVMLPKSMTTKLPAARKAFEARCERVWGTAKTGESTTSVPDWLLG
jgi:hypothetical protein